MTGLTRQKGNCNERGQQNDGAIFPRTNLSRNPRQERANLHANSHRPMRQFYAFFASFPLLSRCAWEKQRPSFHCLWASLRPGPVCLLWRLEEREGRKEGKKLSFSLSLHTHITQSLFSLSPSVCVCMRCQKRDGQRGDYMTTKKWKYGKSGSAQYLQRK